MADVLRHGPESLARGHDDDGEHEQGQSESRGDDGLPEGKRSREDRQAQDAVDDRGDSGEVLDVDLDETGEATRRVGVLLHVDRAEESDRQCEECGERDDPEGAGDRGLGAGSLGATDGGHVLPQGGSEAGPALDGDVREEYGKEDDADRETEEEDPAEGLVDQRLALALEVDGRGVRGGLECRGHW